MYGPADDSGAGLFILWTRTAKVCPVHDMGVYGIFLNNRLPMVLLGLLISIQLLCHQRIYRQLGTLWSNWNTGNTFPWVAFDPRTSLLFLPGKLK
jgi:hypothetical protein